MALAAIWVVIVYAVADNALSPDLLLGDSLDVFIRREDAARFVEEYAATILEIATKLRIEERELEAGGLNQRLLLRGRPERLGIATARGSRQVPPSAPVGVHDVDVAVAVTVADERNLSPVRRPVRLRSALR